jgi:glucose-6-phosphate-specific signal transduction histidine kinase
MKIIIKLVIAGLLLGCLLKMPYGYFQAVRLIGCALFIWLAYLEYKEKRIINSALSVGGALLLNPIFKIYFKRDLWNDIDLAIAIALGIWIIIDLVYLYNGKRSKKES